MIVNVVIVLVQEWMYMVDYMRSFFPSSGYDGITNQGLGFVNCFPLSYYLHAA